MQSGRDGLLARRPIRGGPHDRRGPQQDVTSGRSCHIPLPNRAISPKMRGRDRAARLATPPVASFRPICAVRIDPLLSHGMPNSPIVTTTPSLAARPRTRFRAARGSGADAGIPCRTTTKAVPWGAAGMVFLVVMIECSFARNWLDFTDPVSLSWRYSALAARTRVCDKDLLLLGDSLIKHALIPSVMAEVSGERAENLGAARCPTLMTYFLLRRSLEADARPRAIVFNAKPAVLIGGPTFTQRYFQEILTAAELLRLFQMMHRNEFVVSTLAGRLLPSLRSRLEIRAHLLAVLRGDAGPLHEVNRALWRNWTVNDGANVALPQPPYNGELTAKDAKNLHPHIFYAEKSNAKAIDQLLQLAQERHIPVYWLLPPLSPKLQSERDQSGAESAYENFIRRYQSRYPRTLSILDGRGAGYPVAAFTDATHLNAKGAIALSRTVAKAIERQLGDPAVEPGPRWITLELWSDRSAESGTPLEDVETSRAMVKGTTVINR